MKGKHFFIFMLVITLFVVSYFCYQRYFDFYTSGENDSFHLSLGQTVQIKLYVNGSTGEAICWLNEKDIHIVKPKSSFYKPGFTAQLGYEGVGGIITYTFVATTVGRQIIKMAHCPLAPENKTCEDYTDKETTCDHEFTITVTE